MTGDQIRRVIVVPSVAMMMVKSPQSRKYRLDHLKDLLVSGAALKGEVEDLLLQKYSGLQVRQGTFKVLIY